MSRRKNQSGRAPTGVERRKSERRGSDRIPVEMWVEESKGDELYFQRSGNLSAGGVYLEHTIPHPVGTTVALQFTLPGESEPIKARGEVVKAQHNSELGMGIKFIGMDGPTLARIAAFIGVRSKR